MSIPIRSVSCNNMSIVSVSFSVLVFHVAILTGRLFAPSICPGLRAILLFVVYMCVLRFVNLDTFSRKFQVGGTGYQSVVTDNRLREPSVPDFLSGLSPLAFLSPLSICKAAEVVSFCPRLLISVRS